MVKFIYLLLSFCCTLYFFNYKISKCARLITFQEEETPKEAIYSFALMLVIAFEWALYFSLF